MSAILGPDGLDLRLPARVSVLHTGHRPDGRPSWRWVATYAGRQCSGRATTRDEGQRAALCWLLGGER